MTDYEELMKRCQRGATNLNGANNLLAECYGMMGELGELGADVERLKNHVQSMIDQTTPLVPVPGDPGWSRRITIDELQAEVADLRKDAERYRWLRSHEPLTSEFYQGEQCRELRWGKRLDDLIDLALSKEG